MVERQIRARGITTPRVLDALRRVPRHRFVPPSLEARAYADEALPIDCNQTISQPYIVALMTDALRLEPHHRVLEIGTGCGYQTAVLAELAGEVYTIERHAELARQAQTRLAELGYTNIHFRIGDGTQGWPEEAPFDRIIITAAAPNCPPALWEQLVPGGILVGPFGPGMNQSLWAYEKRPGGSRKERFLCACRFVPLVSDESDLDRPTA